MRSSRSVSAKEIRRVTEWFAAASERIVGGVANRGFAAMLDALDDHVLLLDPMLAGVVPQSGYRGIGPRRTTG